MAKLWQKGCKLNLDVEKFTVGNDFLLDQGLVKYDCIASIAHAKMLHKIGIFSKPELGKLEAGLKNIIKLSEAGKFEIKPEDEDCHTAIENYLTKKLGAAGKKIHTARSRNDQVLTALRLYSKDKLVQTKDAANVLHKTLINLSAKYAKAAMPGYTHQRKAMPYTVGKYFGAFASALEDDLNLLAAAMEITDQNPLGSAAGYGVSIKVDKQLTTKLLGFAKVQENELYCQNSRGKFESIILFALSQIMLDLGKLANDLIMFSMDEFSYFSLPDEFCTGSSIMPHKKNPDVLELVRAKGAVVHSYYLQVVEIAKSLHSGYNRDLQLTKEPLMKGFETTIAAVNIMSLVISNIKVNKDNCKKACTPEIYSVQKAYKMVKNGTAFRDAYKSLK